MLMHKKTPVWDLGWKGCMSYGIRVAVRIFMYSNSFITQKVEYSLVLSLTVFIYYFLLCLFYDNEVINAVSTFYCQGRD